MTLNIDGSFSDGFYVRGVKSYAIYRHPNANLYDIVHLPTGIILDTVPPHSISVKDMHKIISAFEVFRENIGNAWKRTLEVLE